MKLRSAVVCLAVLVCATGLLASAARAQDAPTLAAVRTATPPKLDGTLADPIWKTGSHITLDRNFSYQRPAAEKTDVYLLTDDKYLYLGWNVQQKEHITATVRTNDVGLGDDDVVRVYLFPSGDEGFEYRFDANPIGTRSATSSENAAFAPVWEAVGARTPDGYTVTERIPLAVLRGDGRKTWKIQFERRIVANDSELMEWATNDAQRDPDDVQYAGTITGMNVASRASRPKARLNLYALGEAASQSLGGSTSRVGADLALPITQTASLLATFHPDYSNVELDQQSISPTAFQRQYEEVRPFFTQGANFYNAFNCNDCVGAPFLYTPGIPTPRDGYAVEGTQGPLRFGAFDSLSQGRTDTSGAVGYSSLDHRVKVLFQQSGVDMPGLHDVASYEQLQYGNAHNFSVYATLGQETGSLVADPHEGRYREYGVNFYTQKSGFFAAYHDVGSQYAPVDSFTTINDVHGPSFFTFKEWDFKPGSYITSLNLSEDVQRYKNSAGQWNQTNAGTNVGVMTKNLFMIGYSAGSSWLMLPGTPGGNTNQAGISISYNGGSSTPTDFSHYYGRFGAGYLNSTNRDTAVALNSRTTLSFVANDTEYNEDGGAHDTQWLERVSLGLQLDSRTSIAIGARKIIGVGPTFFGVPSYTNAVNLAASFYKRFGPSELYVVYGDPNALATSPAFIVKYVLYVGAQKGT